MRFSGMMWLVAGLSGVGMAADDPQRVHITVERQDPTAPNAVWKSANPATIFSATDRLRFRVKSNFGGYLYVMNQGTSGTYALLFPRADTGSDNRIEADREYVVPVTQGWFKVAGPPGQDIVYWLVSPVDMQRHYRPLPPPPPKSEIPAGLKPRCDDIIFKARGECIDDTAGIRPVKPGEKLPENLSGVAGATPRELLFMQEDGVTVVSSKTPLTGPVVYELRLAHN